MLNYDFEKLRELFGVRLKEIRTESGLRQEDIARILGVTKATISRYETGVHSPQVGHVKHLADTFSVNPYWLSGMSDDKYEDNRTKYKEIPIFGHIAAGQPILVQENIEGYEYVPVSSKADFCLCVSGDSMIGARIFDGDMVYIRQQPDVENGEIAAVIIDGENATLKRVYKINSSVILHSENPKYQDMIFSKKDFKDVRIIGKCIAAKFWIQ